MPCFRGLAVSIHTPDGALPEYSIQKQAKVSRITTYIPVPPAKPQPDAPTKQSTFAISITLLTPGMRIPYTTSPAGSPDGLSRPHIVGEATGHEKGLNGAIIRPYVPQTSSPNETVAAYIYFDGRAKEEVATLLRRGEETWVNSRWVSVPESEGGGLAEREFLFREVGLERWLNGLDLEGKDVAAKIERRRQRMERRRRWRKGVGADPSESASTDMDQKAGRGATELSNEKYGPERPSDDDDMIYSSDSDSEPPLPEAAGQIKVALFRVLASGEIKRGEYSPQFDAHDDDDEPPLSPSSHSPSTNGVHADPADIDHTTSFAKPKTLDPKSISTQTVTGLDPPDKPYAVFTFFYRSERQLQKMGILTGPKSDEKVAQTPNKRRSLQTDFSKLPPLKPGGTVGFSTFRDSNSMSPTTGQSLKGRSRDSDDSDDDGREDIDVLAKFKDVGGEGAIEGGAMLSAEDAERQGELAEGVRKIKLKRAHSAEPLEDSAPRKATASNPPTASQTPQAMSDTLGTPPAAHHQIGSSAGDAQVANEAMIGSPMKRSRPSLANSDDNAMRRRLGLGLLAGGEESSSFGPAMFAAGDEVSPKKGDEDEDL